MSGTYTAAGDYVPGPDDAVPPSPDMTVAAPDENPFAKFVTPDTPSYDKPPLGSRLGATIGAHVYDSLFGSSVAAGQADPAKRTEQAIQGLSPEEQAFTRQQLTEDLAAEFEASRNNENQQRVTPAQIATIQNDIWPKASSVGDYAADIGGALIGPMLTGPENLLLPEVRAAQAVRAGLPIASRVLSGVGERVFNTGASMAGMSTALNAPEQSNKVAAGLQPEFSVSDFAMAPVTGFAMGALMHGATEAAGAGVRSFVGGFRDARVATTMDDLMRTDPTFAGERPPVTTREAADTADAPTAPVDEVAPVVAPDLDTDAPDGTPAPFETAPVAPPDSVQAAAPATARTRYAPPDPLDLAMSGQLSGERAYAISDEVRTGNRSDEEAILGDRVKEWRRLQREQNSFDDNKAAAATDKIQEIESTLPKEDVDRLYGVGTERTDPEEWHGLSQELIGVEASRPEAVETIARAAKDLPKSNDWASMTHAEQQSTLVILHGMGEEVKRGGDPKALLREAFEERFARDGSKGDAAELARDNAERLARLLKDGITGGGERGADVAARAASDARALPAPPSEAAVLREWTPDAAEPNGPRPQSLATFIARNGGLPLDGEAKAMDLGRTFIPGGGPLARKNGRSIDGYWRERLTEAGYLPPDEAGGGTQRDVRDEIYDLLAKEQAGEKHYSEFDQDRIPAREDHGPSESDVAVAEGRDRLRLELTRDGMRAEDFHESDISDAAELFHRGGFENPSDALEHVIMQKHAADPVGPRVEDDFPGFERDPTPAPRSRPDEVQPQAARGVRDETVSSGAGGERPGQAGDPSGPGAVVPRAEPGGGVQPEGGIRFRKGDGSSGPVDTAGGRVPGPHEPEVIRSLFQQGQELARELNVPLRQGRVGGGRLSLGQYDARYGVARVKMVGDFYTVAHEGAHAVEQQVGKPLTDAIQAAKAELGPLDYDPTRADAGEGFAEWFALALTNPSRAFSAAPTFAQAFRDIVGQVRPALLDTMDHAAAAYDAYIRAPSDARLAAQVVDAQKHGWHQIAHVYEKLREDGLPRTVGLVMGRLYTTFLDRYHPIDLAIRELARGIQLEQGGGYVDIDPSKDPGKLIRLYENAKNGALVMMREGVVPYGEVGFKGPSLMDAISHATSQAKYLSVWKGKGVSDFSTYLTAKRAEVLWNRRFAGELERDPVNFSIEDAKNAQAQLLKANPTFEEAAQMVHQFTRNMLERQRDAGLITVDLHNRLAADPFYVPLFRDVTDKPMLGQGGAGGGADKGPGMVDTVKRLKGSTRDIIDPIQGIMMQTLLAERTIRHNDIVVGLADLAERAGYRAGGVVEAISARELSGIPVDVRAAIESAARSRGMDPADTALLMSSVVNAFGDDPIMGTMFKMQPTSGRGEPILFYKVAGDLRAVRLSADKEGLALYESLTALPRVASDIWLKMSNMTTRMLRFGIVTHPTFALTNFIKDQVAVGILRKDYVPFFSGLPGVVSELTQNDAAKLYAFMGGQSPGTAATGIAEAAKADVHQLARGAGSGVQAYASAHLTNFEGVSEITQITEAATRNSIFAKVYQQKLKQGASPLDAAIEAAYQGTDILDFGRYGSRTLVVRALVPFLNVHIQALDKARRTMLQPLGRKAFGEILTTDENAALTNAGWALGKFAAVGGPLGFLLAATMWEREEYRDATPEQKAQNLILPIGKTTYRIPKPFELSLGFTAGEYAYARLFQNDPRAAAQLAEAAWEVLKTPDILAGNPLIKSAVENWTGVSLFTGRAIVPDALKGRDPQFQYNERTSPLARGISNYSNVISDFLNSHTNPGVAKIMGFENAWSPMKVDNTIGNMFGTFGREAQSMSQKIAGDESGPEQRFEDTAFVKRFTIDPTRWSNTIQRYYEFAGQKTGEYAQSAKTFTDLFQNGHATEARDWLAQLPDDKKAYAILNVGGDDDGKTAFKPDARRLNPITRAQTAVSTLQGVAREVLNNTLMNTDSNEPVAAMNPTVRRDVLDSIHQLGAMEMRNSLVAIGDKGYADRKIMSVQDQFNALKAISPDVADEVARRYATAKVYKTENVAAGWPALRTTLLREGTNADLSMDVIDAQQAGWEFDGEKTGRRVRKRAVIPASP